MPTEICGYMVVRRPAKNYDALGRGAHPTNTFTVGGHYYSGIQRMEWFDVDEDYYSGSLPAGFTEIVRTIQRASYDTFGIPLCKNPALAHKLLDYSNRANDANELIGVFSEHLKEAGGSMTVSDPDLRQLGIDVVA